MKELYDVIIIGAGAAGLAAAIACTRRKKSCLIIDKNKKPGNKLYATGNGRCNVTNDYYSSDCYYNNPFADTILQETNLKDFTLQFLNEIGIQPTSKNGYYYPMSMQASSVVWAMLDAIDNSYADFLSNTTVTAIHENHNDQATVNLVECTDHKTYKGKSIILSMGGCSAPKLGAAEPENLDAVFRSLDISYRPYHSALAPVNTAENLHALSGVRQHAVLTIGAVGIQEAGELQFTEDGISGIVVFNLSEHIRALMTNSTPDVYINPIPDISENEFISRYKNLCSTTPGKSLLAFLNGYINDKLARYLIEQMQTAGILQPPKKLCDLTQPLVSQIYHYITEEFHVTPVRIGGFDKSQASAGGIYTNEIQPNTMELYHHKGIYAAGETIDVLGKCGGYNISFALYTGWTAGTLA